MTAAFLILITVLAAYRIGWSSGRLDGLEEAVDLIAAQQRHPSGVER